MDRDSDCNNEQIVTIYEYNLSDEIELREQEIDYVSQELIDIHDIFNTLNLEVTEQEYLLNNIENNFTEINENLGSSTTIFRTKNKKQSKCNLILLYIFLILAIFSLIMIIILSKKFK